MQSNQHFDDVKITIKRQRPQWMKQSKRHTRNLLNLHYRSRKINRINKFLDQIQVHGSLLISKSREKCIVTIPIFISVQIFLFFHDKLFERQTVENWAQKRVTFIDEIEISAVTHTHRHIHLTCEYINITHETSKKKKKSNQLDRT